MRKRGLHNIEIYVEEHFMVTLQASVGLEMRTEIVNVRIIPTVAVFRLS